MRVVTATLRKTRTEDGLFKMHDHVPIGKQYRVDLDSIRVNHFYNTVCIRDDDGTYLPTELLFIPGHTV